MRGAFLGFTTVCCYLCTKGGCMAGQRIALLCMPYWLGILRFDRTLESGGFTMILSAPSNVLPLPYWLAIL